MVFTKGAPAPFFLSVCSPRQRDDAILKSAIQAFEAGHLAEALIAAEYACRRYPNNCLPAILRAKILSSTNTGLVAKAWYRAWCCDPLDPALQDALLRSWLASGAAATAAELGAAFLPARCRAGTQDSLLALLRSAGVSQIGACWKAGEDIEAVVYGAAASVRVALSDEQHEYQFDVPGTGARFRLRPPKANGVWSLALGAAPMYGSPLVFAHPQPVTVAQTPGNENIPVPPAQAGAPGKTQATRATIDSRPPGNDNGVSIVIPVYRDAALVQSCIESVLATLPLNQTKASVVVVDDASPEPLLSAWLDRLAAAQRIVLLRNRRNLGFIETVNRGMRALPGHDPLLLNADTLVHGDWIDRLATSLYSTPDIASVSPWSNNGEITSFPRAAHPAPPPTPAQLAELDDLAAALHRSGASADVELPAVCGFAMLMRRSAVDNIGLFDGAELVRGYSEEVDWCQRARAAGLRHLAATGVFVAHVGTVSFRFEKMLRVRQNRAAISARYPDFYREYLLALRDDALAAPRAALESVLAPSSPRKRGPLVEKSTTPPTGSTSAAAIWYDSAMIALDGLGEFSRPLPAALPKQHARIGIWQRRDGARFPHQILALARLLASQPEGSNTPRLLVIGEASDALWRTGVVDVLPFNPETAENTLLSDAAMVGLAGCSALLGEADAAAPMGVPYTVLDESFDPQQWLSTWRTTTLPVIPAQAGTPGKQQAAKRPRQPAKKVPA
ncbi:MAG TPA: glycosyltransferase [Telluria sp.]|nr:glycosyltransferase [Telluria sp.]